MNMKYLKLTACLILAAGLFIGCEDEFLERPPLDSFTDANYFQTADQILSATAPLYNLVWFDYNDKAAHGIGDARGGVLFSPSYQAPNIRLNTNSTTLENTQSFSSFFNVVAQSNSIISNIEQYAGPSVPENMKQYGIAEARFMRGLAYYFLVQNWGPVPIITNNVAVLQDTSITRNTVESVWEFIIRDFQYATDVMPASGPQLGRLNKWAAEGMLAKAYLTSAGVGGSRNQEDLQKAAQHAKNVIDNSGASLLPDYRNLFLTANNNNRESLFALQWQYNSAFWGTQNTTQAYLAFGASITGFADGWGGDVGASKYLLDLYEPNDERRKPTFMFPGDYYPEITQQMPDPNDPSKVIYPKLNVPLNTADGYSNRAWVKKYIVGRPEDNGGEVSQMGTGINTYILRLADVYLIYAEAKLPTGGTLDDAEAKFYFNAVRERAGLDPLDVITIDEIYEERMVEFAMEGQAWYDFVRLHYYDPAKAYDMISNQDRGSYRIIPNAPVNATSWEIVSDTPAFYQISDANFRLPIPETVMAKAPNLRKDPVPYNFDGE